MEAKASLSSGGPIDRSLARRPAPATLARASRRAHTEAALRSRRLSCLKFYFKLASSGDTNTATNGPTKEAFVPAIERK